MKIALAQYKSLTGNIPENTAKHLDWAETAAKAGANLILFPELSLTGYEPELADKLAIENPEEKFSQIQEKSNALNIIIGVGVPLKGANGITISLLLFHPNEPLQIYHKHFLHEDELPFFVSGENDSILLNNHPEIALAICYEISVEAHIEKACNAEASVFLASVAKFKNGLEGAESRLSSIAKDYSMTVLMANSIGEADGGICVGGTAVWDSNGALLGQLDNHSEGILLFDLSVRSVSAIGMTDWVG